MPAMVRIIWPPQPTVVDPKRFPMLRPQSRNCSHGRTLCSRQSGRTGDFNRARADGAIQDLSASPWSARLHHATE